MDGWKITFLLGWPIFRGELLDFELLGFGSVDDDHLDSFSALLTHLYLQVFVSLVPTKSKIWAQLYLQGWGGGVGWG